MTYLSLTGSDTRMDSRNSVLVNPLPQRCERCHFPDIDFVPQPYRLIDARTKNPNDLAPAELGNFLVRQRAKDVLEIVIPGQCAFYPTVLRKTGEQSSWFLAVPNGWIDTGQAKADIERCSACGEPKSAHWGSQYDYSQTLAPVSGDAEIFKAAHWSSSVREWSKDWTEQDWIYRHLLISPRLYHLLKQLKLKGLVEATCGSETKPTSADQQWIAKKRALLIEQGRRTEPPSESKRSSLATIYSGQASNRPAPPRSYLEFVTAHGPKSYFHVDEQEGFTVQLLEPSDLDYVHYRRGVLRSEDEETNEIDGVMFAETLHGDCLCFDFSGDVTEPSVVIYLHEMNYFEPYAANFTECLQRLEGVGSSETSERSRINKTL
ncbi:hypothetical protein CCAX7_20900 [Capsulimonas corticalis]|uniref:Uncharacterized protein n=1 Tax=Capsulimonas corticalis TaxID=2219043 RepID=A0A402D2D4_9BACT|nr:SMI1/KNR4 family protein [Capsulimonas corticalis]BDI30039.1 hypothetical protein CCAX7_20900 [Capsulimonas corticalis]